MIRLLPSYVGSKFYWVKHLQEFKGENFIEPFCGTAALSINLASTAILNDKDPILCHILKNYDQLIVPEVFTQEDYFKTRNKEDWWRYIYCLQKMSFSGVFRYSKNGYNVPIIKRIPEVKCQEEYLAALAQYKKLKPTITCDSYRSITPDQIKGKIVILDPPYQGSKASYNCKFNYDRYWKYVKRVVKIAKATILFDRDENITKIFGDIQRQHRNMRVNGKYQGGLEAMVIFYG